MPRLPDIATLGARPTPAPGLGVASYRPQTGAEAAVPQAVIGIGKGVEALGNEAYASYKVEKEKFDRTGAEDALNQLREAQLELTIGEQRGFVHRKGAKAIDPAVPGEYGGLFNDAVKRIESSLANDEQRTLFRSRAGVARTQFQQDLLSHRLRENEAHRKQTFEAGLDIEIKMGTTHWQSPKDVEASLTRIDALIAGMDLDPQVAESIRRKAHGTVHRGVIQQALSDEKTDYAEQWLKKYRKSIDPEVASAVFSEIQRETQKHLYNGYVRRFLDTGDSLKGLAALKKDVLADPKLVEERKNGLLANIMQREGQIEARAAAQQAQWMSQVGRQIDAVRKSILSGYPDHTGLNALITSTGGTIFAPEVKQLSALGKAFAEFAATGAVQQEALVNRQEGEARAGRGDPGIANALRALYENQKNLSMRDPQTFAQRHGIVPPDSLAAQDLNFSKPEMMAPGLIARYDTATGLALQRGTPVKILREAEATTLAATIKTLKWQDKASYLGALARGLSGHPKAFQALMGQLVPDDPAVAIAGGLAANNRPIALQILRGQEILHPNPKQDGTPARGALLQMPKEAEMMREFKTVVGDAYGRSPEAQNAYFQASLAAYAARVAETPSTSEEINTRLWRKTIQEVTGGIGNYNGRNVPIPHGMDSSQFRDEIRRRVNDMVKRGDLQPVVTKERVLDMPIVAVGDGIYRFVSGDGQLADATGRTVELNLNELEPGPARLTGPLIGDTGGGAATGIGMRPGDRREAGRRFIPEAQGYDFATAAAAGMTPDASGHWGSVAPASAADKRKYKLPDESYIVLKGRGHETWPKTVAAEEARGFKIEKIGSRYYSVPASWDEKK